MTIDVSKCEYYMGGECLCNYCVAYGYEITSYDNCKDHKDCYYKQLHQANAKIKELKKQLERIKKYCKNNIKKPIGIYNWRGELVYTVREHQKICNHILQIIESEE